MSKIFEPVVCDGCPCFIWYESEYDGRCENWVGCGLYDKHEQSENFNGETGRFPGCRIVSIIIKEKEND